MKTARLFMKDTKAKGMKERYYLHNIVLGILLVSEMDLYPDMV